MVTRGKDTCSTSPQAHPSRVCTARCRTRVLPLKYRSTSVAGLQYFRRSTEQCQGIKKGCASQTTSAPIQGSTIQGLTEEERSHFLQASTPCEELVSCSLRYVGNGIVASSLEVFHRLLHALWILFRTARREDKMRLHLEL